MNSCTCEEWESELTHEIVNDYDGTYRVWRCNRCGFSDWQLEEKH